MNVAMKIVLSMSASASLLILALLTGKRFLKDKVSRQWQYYIWLIVIVRLLLPFAPEINVMGSVRQTVERIRHTPDNVPDRVHFGAPVVSQETDDQKEGAFTETTLADTACQDIFSLLREYTWFIWLLIALGMLMRKITAYQSFIRYVDAGATAVADTGILERLAEMEKQVGVKRPIEISVNPLIASPMLIGIRHPCIVLPSVNISEKEFYYIMLHELMHYKRWDIWYKWLVQFTLCLHWYNPLVYLMSREITRACEFSCDEAVLIKVGHDDAPDYGEVLLDAMAAIGKYKEKLCMQPLNGNKQLLKERLGAIMQWKERSKTTMIVTGALTLGIFFGAAFLGVYPVTVAAHEDITEGKRSDPVMESEEKEISVEMAEKFYEADSMLLFAAAFSELDEEAQGEWLDRIYADGEIAFLSVCIDDLETDATDIQRLAKKAYADGETGFFSVLADHMSEKALERWLDKALKEEQIAFQAVLYDKLERNDEWDDMKAAVSAQQLEEYKAYGIVSDGKTYYYKEQLVNVFLDVHEEGKFYTLNMDPRGIVNVKVSRNDDGEIESVGYMTEAEIRDLFGEEN